MISHLDFTGRDTKLHNHTKLRLFSYYTRSRLLNTPKEVEEHAEAVSEEAVNDTRVQQPD